MIVISSSLQVPHEHSYRSLGNTQPAAGIGLMRLCCCCCCCRCYCCQNRTATIYTGNPRKNHVSFIFHMHSLNASVPLEPYTGIGGNSRTPSMTP